MNKVELFENERARGYDQFVESWIPNYHYLVGCGTGNEIERFVDTAESWTITG